MSLTGEHCEIAQSQGPQQPKQLNTRKHTFIAGSEHGTAKLHTVNWMNKWPFLGYVSIGMSRARECDRQKTHLVAAPVVADCSLVLACPAFVSVC